MHRDRLSRIRLGSVALSAHLDRERERGREAERQIGRGESGASVTAVATSAGLPAHGMLCFCLSNIRTPLLKELVSPPPSCHVFCETVQSLVLLIEALGIRARESLTVDRKKSAQTYLFQNVHGLHHWPELDSVVASYGSIQPGCLIHKRQRSGCLVGSPADQPCHMMVIGFPCAPFSTQRDKAGTAFAGKHQDTTKS